MRSVAADEVRLTTTHEPPHDLPDELSDEPLDPRVVRTRATVLASGSELLAEAGVRGITVEEIARRTGIAKTTIYRHWPSREDLVLAVIAESAFELPAPRTNDPVRDMRAILVALWEAMSDPVRRSAVASMLESSAANPELGDLHRAFLTARRGPLEDAVRRAIETGAVRTELAPDLVPELLGAPILVRAFMRADPPDRRYVDHLMHEVLGTPTAKRPRGKTKAARSARKKR